MSKQIAVSDDLYWKLLALRSITKSSCWTELVNEVVDFYISSMGMSDEFLRWGHEVIYKGKKIGVQS